MDDLTIYTIYTLIVAALLAERAYSIYASSLSNTKHKKLLAKLLRRDLALDEAITLSGSSNPSEAIQLLGLTPLHTMKGECIATDDTVLVDPKVYYNRGKYFFASSKGYLYAAKDIMVTGTTGLKMSIPS